MFGKSQNFWGTHITTIMPLVFVGLCVLSVRLILISLFGNATPFWDQWDSEAALLYKPWVEGKLSLSDLFSTHAEHRIFMTRILGIGLLELNGRVWDPLLQMKVNAVLSTAGIVLLVYMLSKSLENNYKKYLYIFSAVLFSIPFGWENILAGFQSQFYFFILLSLIFLWNISNSDMYTSRWWFGVFCGLLTPLSLAAGAFTLIAGTIVFFIKNIAAKNYRIISLWPGFALLAVAGFFVAYTPSLSFHAGLKAQNFTHFLWTILAIGSWPLPFAKTGWLLVNFPIVAFGLRFVFDKSSRRQSHFFVLGVALWVFGQYLSIAYGRAEIYNSSRYLDLFALGLALNLFAILSMGKAGMKNIALKLFAILWISGLVFGFATKANGIKADISAKYNQGQSQEKNVRGYLCTKNQIYLYGKPHLDIPYPNAERLKNLLDDNTVRSVLSGKINPDNASELILRDGEPFCPPAGLSIPYKTQAPPEFSDSSYVMNKKIIQDSWRGSDSAKSTLQNFEVHGSFLSSDSDTGLLTIQVKKGERVRFKSGPRVQNQYVIVNDKGGRLFYTNLPVALSWIDLVFDNEDLADSFTLTFVDAGTGWGEWSAIALRKQNAK